MRNLLALTLIAVCSIGPAQGVRKPLPEFTIKYIADRLNDFEFTYYLNNSSQDAGALQPTQVNWCGDSAHVSYIGHHNSSSDDLMLDFSLNEPHTEKQRGISWYYTVTYSCYQRGPYTKDSVKTEILSRGMDHKAFDEEFIAHECPLPDHSYPHIERVQITRINCN